MKLAQLENLLWSMNRRILGSQLRACGRLYPLVLCVCHYLFLYNLGNLKSNVTLTCISCCPCCGLQLNTVSFKFCFEFSTSVEEWKYFQLSISNKQENVDLASTQLVWFFAFVLEYRAWYVLFIVGHCSKMIMVENTIEKLNFILCFPLS